MTTNQTTPRLDLAQALTDRHLTHRRVAFLVDASESTVSNWCRGLTPSPERRERLLEVLNEAGSHDNLPVITETDLWGDR